MVNFSLLAAEIGSGVFGTPQISDSHWRHSSSTSIRVLQRIRGVTIMRYINLHFTYLLTYLLTCLLTFSSWQRYCAALYIVSVSQTLRCWTEGTTCTATKERQAWCCLQVKLCDPRLSALSVPWCKKALYKYSSFPFLSFYSAGRPSRCALAHILVTSFSLFFCLWFPAAD